MVPKTDIEVHEVVGTSQRVSIGLIAISLSLLSLSLGIALFSSSGVALFVAPAVSLSSTPSTATAITVTWTAPGDDGVTGTATSYDLRMSTMPITNLNFGSATQFNDEPSPQVAGSTETYTATNLIPTTTYYFALKTSDELNNVSALSNIASKTTDPIAQACLPIYTCTAWSACVNNAQTRTCSVTNGCPAGLDQPVSSQLCTSPPAYTPPPDSPGTGGSPVHVIRHVIAVGTGPGIRPLVRVIAPSTGKVTKEFAPFSGTERKGTNIAAGEFTGDQLPDIAVGTGAGTSAKVKVFTDRGAQFAEFNPYPTQTGTGVSLAAGDVNGDGRDELITVPAKDPSQVRVFSYNLTTKKFEVYAQGFAYDRRLLNGFSVAAADINLDGQAEIIVAPRTKGKTITVWRVTAAKTLQHVLDLSPYPLTPTSGLTVSTGDVNGDGRPDILTALGSGYWTDLKVFDNFGRRITSFEPYARSYLGGVMMTSLDVNGDGRDEIVLGLYGHGDPYLRIFRYDGATKKFSRIKNYLVYPLSMQAGVRLGSI